MKPTELQRLQYCFVRYHGYTLKYFRSVIRSDFTLNVEIHFKALHQLSVDNEQTTSHF